MNRPDDADAGPWWRLVTPATAPGAVACFELAGDVEAALRRLGIASVGVGELRLRHLHSLDHVLVARISSTIAHLMPHGGIAIVRAVESALLAAGIPRSTAGAPATAFPEATTALEAHVLAWLARATSPEATDMLLDQPRRWREAGWDADKPPPRPRSDRDRLMDRLLVPPLVVALGPPNVGKSTLLNALARRRVSIVADQPGTTRDHVGALLDLDGLTVRYVDTPGVRDQGADPIEARAIAASLDVAQSADLVLLVTDQASPWRVPSRLAAQRSLTVQTRADLHPGDIGADIRLERMHVAPESAAGPLAAAIRERLLPRAAMLDPSPWALPDLPA